MQRTLELVETVPANTPKIALNLQTMRTCHLRELKLIQGGHLMVLSVGWGEGVDKSFTFSPPVTLTMAAKLASTFAVGKVVESQAKVVLICSNETPAPILVKLQLIVQEF